MEGHCTLSVLFHIALSIGVVGRLTWLGTILQIGSVMGFEIWFGYAVHPVQHSLLLWHRRGRRGQQ